ncbi:MAG: hypothetical protein WC554_06155 [Clostridia bacterium]|jgi:hypothetical protein
MKYDIGENELSGEFNTRVWNSLRRHGIETIAKLAELYQNSGEIEIRNIGTEGKKEIMACLARHGIQAATNTCRRSLYMCRHARVTQVPDDKDKEIYCSRGYILDTASRINGKVPLKLLAEGRPLEFPVCQVCKDYLEEGGPLIPEERGWLKR